jgi:hypothetical protein
MLGPDPSIFGRVETDPRVKPEGDKEDEGDEEGEGLRHGDAPPASRPAMTMWGEMS